MWHCPYCRNYMVILVTPDQARALINNFCAEYCEGQTTYMVGGKAINAETLNDAEAIDAANKLKVIMHNFAIDEAKGATKQ